MKIALFSVFLLLLISCQKEKQAPQIKVTLTTSASDSLRSATFYLTSLKVHSKGTTSKEEAISLYQNDDGLIFTHDLSKEQTTTILESSLYEINLFGLEPYFFITNIDNRPTQLFQIDNDSTPIDYNTSTPIDYNLPFPENSTLGDTKSYEINIKVPVDEAIIIQKGSVFNWSNVVVSIKEL